MSVEEISRFDHVTFQENDDAGESEGQVMAGPFEFQLNSGKLLVTYYVVCKDGREIMVNRSKVLYTRPFVLPGGAA